MLGTILVKSYTVKGFNFNEVSQLINKLTKIDQEDFVIDYYERVEADIVLEKEVYMQKLLAYYQKLVDEVHERKVKCLLNLKTNNALEGELDTIKQTLAEHESQLKRENLDFIIKTLDGDEDKWKAIQSECAALLEKVKSLEEKLQKGIISDQVTSFKPSTADVQIENICGDLQQRTIDSTIITGYFMKDDLIKLCKLSGKQFKLLYRATRDGFGVSSFHAKCDQEANTLTIIKATSGYIFGGYTSVEWDSESFWKPDPDSFIFSLVNFISAPQLMPVLVEDHSILCDASYGPTFGSGHCIYICDKSNVFVKSMSYLDGSYEDSFFENKTDQIDTFLAGSRLFKTREIEVFQLV